MPSTISYQPGDLVLVEFPFTGPGTKLRPALVVLDSGDADVVLARVTTPPYDIHLTDWRQAGLLAPSFVRLHKLATLSKPASSAGWNPRSCGSRASVNGAEAIDSRLVNQEAGPVPDDVSEDPWPNRRSPAHHHRVSLARRSVQSMHLE